MAKIVKKLYIYESVKVEPKTWWEWFTSPAYILVPTHVTELEFEELPKETPDES